MRFAWTTDLHFDSVELDAVDRFCDAVAAAKVEGLIISGDIAESKSLVDWLTILDRNLGLPVYFVLGNHDFYGGSVAGVRRTVGHLDHARLKYLPATGPVDLGDGVAMVGHDGWGDCRIGEVDNFAILTDYLAIKDLSEVVDRDDVLMDFQKRGPLIGKLRALGDEAAEQLRPHLEAAAGQSNAVVVVTHVPPFRQAAWHGGSISEEKWLPGFTCKAIGDLLETTANAHPDCRITVLCGPHTRDRPRRNRAESRRLHRAWRLRASVVWVGRIHGRQGSGTTPAIDSRARILRNPLCYACLTVTHHYARSGTSRR